MQHDINRLLHFAISHNLLQESDRFYAANHLIDLLQEPSYVFEKIKEGLESPAVVLDSILAKAIERNIIEDSQVQRDLFDTRIMDCLTPRPSDVIDNFWLEYENNPKNATTYLYNLSISSNYIRKTRTDKNIIWKSDSDFGELDITINVSKPEKDPKDIALAKNMPSSGYPSCLLCRENEGFAGNFNHPARQNLRLIPVDLAGDSWFMQYSPYIYYNEHCIFLNSLHTPMRINKSTFRRLLKITEIFPHYFVGANADLPIVGGSILSHDHYQGGKHTFALAKSPLFKEYQLDSFADITFGYVKWPMSTLRLISDRQDRLLDAADAILHAWREYSDPDCDIIASSDGDLHNTITAIARRRGKQFELDLVLRNNRTCKEHPMGIFHPHADVHHIKKENIGVIEVMGLAVLPARLSHELAIIKNLLISKNKSINDYPELHIHTDWFNRLYPEYAGKDESYVDQQIKKEVGKKFLQCLIDAGVYKFDQSGLNGVDKFVSSLNKD